jgi:hypothetical protein
MCGAITLLPQYDFMAWCLVKHRGNFTLLYFILREEQRLKVPENRALRS